MENVRDGIQTFQIFIDNVKSVAFRYLRANKAVGCSDYSIYLRDWQCKQAFASTNDFWILESCQLYIIAKHEASNYFKTEVVIQRCSGKKVSLKILKNSQENLCARVSGCNFNKKGVWHVFLWILRNFCKIRTKSLKSAKFHFQLFLTALDIMDSLYTVIKHDDHRKMFFVESILQFKV